MQTHCTTAINVALLCFCLFAGAPTLAQQDDDDFIIIEDQVEVSDSAGTKPGGLRGVTFSGELIGSYAGFAGVTERYQSSLKLRYFQEFNDNFSVVVEGRAYTSGVKLQFTSVEDFRNSNGAIDFSRTKEETFIRKVTASRLDLNEGYLRFNRGIIDIYAGRRKLVLGQFDLFSPVDFLLPIDLSSNEVNFTKLERRYAQTMASFYLYPMPELELQFHYLPFLERDPISTGLLEVPSLYYVDGTRQEVPFQRPKNTNQFLARAIYTGDKITAGLTFYKGFQLFPQDRRRLVPRSNGHVIVPEPTYPSLTGFGFEMSIPVRRVLLKYEAVIGELFEPLNERRGSFDERIVNYNEFLLNNLGGRLYVNGRFLLHALGYDFLGENWTVNFILFHFLDLPNSTDKEALRLSDAFGSSDSLGISVIPAFNIARHWGRNKAQTTGFVLGYFGTTFGYSAYHTYKMTDNLSALFSYEYFSYDSDSNVESQVDNEERAAAGPDAILFVSESGSSGGVIRIGFQYKF